MEVITPINTNKATLSAGETRLQEHRMDKLDQALTDLPKSFDKWLSCLNSYCIAGSEVASLLEVILDGSPLQSVATQYREACELLTDKCTSQEEVLQQEFTSACTQIGPLVNHLRSCLSSRSKMAVKYKSTQAQLEAVSSSDSKSKAKFDQAELKCENALKDLTKQDEVLNNINIELDSTNDKALGSWFLSILDVQSQLLTSAQEVMSSLSIYKGLDLLSPSLHSTNHPLVKEATLQWLASAQVYRNLRSNGSLSSYEAQFLTGGSDRLSQTVRKGINGKVNTLLKSYLSELNKTINVARTIPGGFHLNSKGTELALQDCCSSLDAVGAGAPRAKSKEEKEELIERDIPHTTYRIDSTLMGGANDIHDSIQEKLMFIEKLASTLNDSQRRNVPSEKLQEFASHVLSEACTTVIYSASRTAVQLMYGKANLVLVKESPRTEDQFPIEITAKDDSILLITAHSIWWIVEDCVTLSSLSRPTPHHTFLATVQSVYSLEIDLNDFIDNNSSFVSIPSIQVKCSQVNLDYFSIINSSRSTRSPRKERHSDLPPDNRHAPLPSGRLSSSDSDGLQDDSASTGSANTITSPLLDQTTSSRGRGSQRPLYRTNSSDSIHSVSTTTTLKASNLLFEPEQDDDLLSILSNPHGLNQTSLLEHTTKETKLPPSTNPRRYSSRRKDPQWSGGGGERNEGKRDEIDATNKRKDKSNSVGSLHSLDNKFTLATNAEFEHVFTYLGDSGGSGGDEERKISKKGKHYKYRQHPQPDYIDDIMTSRHRGNDDFTTNLDAKSMEELSSQVIIGPGGEEEDDVGRPRNPHMVSNSTGSLDSGIGVHYRNGNSLKRNGRLPDENNWELFLNHPLGPFYPPSESSDSEPTSGRNSRDNNFQSSQEDIPGRSSSLSSYHSLGGGGPVQLNADNFSLPDQDFVSFNQAPGSHRGSHHRRHPSLSSYNDPLSQEGYEPLPSRGSFSQELPRTQDVPPPIEFPHHNSGPGGHFSHPNYDHDPSVMRPNGGNGPSQYLSDPYPGAPSPFPPHDRMQRQYPPLPHPPHHPPPHYWDGYGGGPMMNMPPPPPHRGTHPPHEMFRPGPPFRTTTPDISPAPSPRPTPPPTPPPHPPPMNMQPSPIRMGPAPRPHLPNMYRGPPPLRGEFPEYPHMPRGMPPPPQLPHHQAPPPHGHMPHPQRLPIAPIHGRMLEWGAEQPHWRH